MSIVFSSILNQNSLHFDSQLRPRASKNRSRDTPRASKTPPRHQKPPKDLPRASPDLPRTISDHFFIQKRISEPQFSSRELPISKIDSPKSTFGGRRHGACPIKSAAPCLRQVHGVLRIFRSTFPLYSLHRHSPPHCLRPLGTNPQNASKFASIFSSNFGIDFWSFLPPK